MQPYEAPQPKTTILADELKMLVNNDLITEMGIKGRFEYSLNNIETVEDMVNFVQKQKEYRIIEALAEKLNSAQQINPIK